MFADVFKIIGFALLCGFVVLLLKQYNKPEVAMLCALAGGLLLFAFSLPQLLSVWDNLLSLAKGTQIDSKDTLLLCKAGGIALLGQLTSQILRDMGNGTVAEYMECGIKILLLFLCLPLFEEFLSLLGEFTG